MLLGQCWDEAGFLLGVRNLEQSNWQISSLIISEFR